MFGVKGYKTLKSAYADGWHEPDKDEYGWEDEMTLKGHFLVIGAKKAMSRTTWTEKGYSVKEEAIMHPHGALTSGSCDVYRDDQVEQIAKKDSE